MCMKTTRANTVEPSDAVNRCTAAHVTSHHNTLSSSYTRTMFKRQHVLVPNHRFLLSWPSEIGRSTSTSSHTSSRHIILSGPLFKGRTRRPVWPYRYPSNRTHRAHILVPLIKRDFHSQTVGLKKTSVGLLISEQQRLLVCGSTSVGSHRFSI